MFNNSCVTKWSDDEETSPLNPPQRDKHSFIHLFTDSHNISVTASALSGPLDPDDDFSSDSQNHRGNKSGPDL